MPDGISHSNKDILFKVLSQNYPNKSLSAYGLDIPRIKTMLPADFPVVSATESHADSLFLLEGDMLYLQEYESVVKRSDFVKYTRYVCHALDWLDRENMGIKRVIIGVIYTGDVKSAPAVYDLGALRVELKQVFLSKFDTDKIYADLSAKVKADEKLSDEDTLKLIILPLTQPIKDKKQELTENAISLAKQIQDEMQQIFVLAGILTAANKFIDQTFSNQVKEWIKMTKVARLFEEEKIQAVNEARIEARNEARIETRLEMQVQFVKNLLSLGMDSSVIEKSTGLSGEEVERIRSSLISA